MLELFTIFNLVWRWSSGIVFKRWRFFAAFLTGNRSLNDRSRIFAMYRRNNSTSWILYYRYTEDSRNAIFWTFVNYEMREIAVLFEAMTVKNTCFLAERVALCSLLKLPWYAADNNIPLYFDLSDLFAHFRQKRALHGKNCLNLWLRGSPFKN